MDETPQTQRPVLGVSVLVHCGKKAVLAKRGKEPAKGLWSLPGGKVEWGESLEAAARRELEEECSLTVDALEFGEFVEIIRSSHHFVIAVFKASVVTCMSVRAGDDAADARWFDFDEMKRLNEEEKMTQTTFDRVQRLTGI